MSKRYLLFRSDFLVLSFFLVSVFLSFGLCEEYNDDFKKGEAFYFEKKMSIAESLLTKSLRQDVLNHKAHFYLANILTLDEKYERAAEHYKKAIDLHPCSSYYYNYGSMCLLEKSYQKALRLYEKALEENPRKYNAEAAKAQVYIETFEYGKAVESLSNVLVINPIHPDKEKIVDLMDALRDNFSYAEKMRESVDFFSENSDLVENTNMSFSDLFGIDMDDLGKEEEIESKNEEPIKEIELEFDVLEDE